MNYGLYKTSGTIPTCIQNEFEKLQSKYPSLRKWYLVPIDSVIGRPETIGGSRTYYKHIVLCRWLWEHNPPNHPDILDILLHEVAHALIAPHRGHDNIFRRMARRVGCKEVNARVSKNTTLKAPPDLVALREAREKRKRERKKQRVSV